MRVKNRTTYHKPVESPLIFILSGFGGRPGMFNVYPQELYNEWIHCRETLQRRWGKNNRRLLFWTKNGVDLMAEFIKIIEDKLGLQERSVVKPTNIGPVAYINASPFWAEQGIKKSFFSMILRAGMQFDGDNFEDALYSTKYTQNTKDAIKRFLSGATECRGLKSDQWVENYCYRPGFWRRFLRRRLLKKILKFPKN